MRRSFLERRICNLAKAAMPKELSVLCPLLIGRAVDLESLDRALQTVGPGKGQTVLIAGEAGVGKTRLVAETKARASQLRFSILQGNCFEHDPALPYAPLLDLLRAFPAATLPEEMARTVDEDGEIARLILELSPSFPNHAPLTALEPEQEKRRLFQALAQWFIRHVGRAQADRLQSPLLVIVEDLHWSDDTSLEFLLFLARRVTTQPILLLLTFRSDQLNPELEHFLGSLDRERLASELSLAPLTPGEVDSMLRATFGLSRPVRAEFLNALYTLTEGNPFFIEEVLKSLVASGKTIPLDGEWEKAIDELHIPRTVQDAVRQRTDRLSSPAREILSFAAVAGRRFDFLLLQALTQREDAELLQNIKELIAAQLVVEESADRFAFRHALTRQAIYAGFLARERAVLHSRIAETMERIDASELDNHLTELAYHFYEAGDWEKALNYSWRAGEQAQALYTPRAAIEQFTRALNASQKLHLTPPVELIRARGKAYETLGDFELALDDYTRALDAARASHDGPAEWNGLIDLGFLWAGRDYERTGEYFRSALALATSLTDPNLLARSLNRMGNWHLNKEEPLQAQQYHEQALEVFRGLNDARGLAETFDLLGMSSNLSGNLIQGSANYEQAVALFRELDDRQGLASTLAGMALASGGTYQTETMVAALPNLAASVKCCDQSLKIAREIGWRSGESYALWIAGFSLGPLGEYARALEVTQNSLEIAEEIGHRQWMSAAHCALGAIYHDMRLSSPARQHLEQALTLAKETGSLHWLRVSSGLLASACILQGEVHRAELVLGPALDLAGPGQTLGQRLMSCARVELALERGEPEMALDLLDQLVAVSAPKNTRRPILRLSKLRGQVMVALGRTAEAEVALLAAKQSAVDEGAKPMLWRIHALLGKLYLSRSRQDPAETEIEAARKLIDGISASVPVMWRQNYLRAALDSLPVVNAPSPRRLAKKEFGGLTEREREVAALIAQGKTNREIADSLVVGERTIETHVGNILSKLGFTSRAQVAAWSVQKGLNKGVE
jgi:DNA-binding CsgD family transcriptional regulator/tetratricopeptide (TPR) repeat protein